MPTVARGVETETGAREPAHVWKLSKAQRAVIRQRAMLAKECDNIHSFTQYGTVWTIRQVVQRVAKPLERDRGEVAGKPSGEPSKRKQRSAERARAHRAMLTQARAFRLAHLFRRWSQKGAPQQREKQVLAPSEPMLEAALYASAADADGAPERGCAKDAPVRAVQQQERMDDERAAKRGVPQSPAVEISPTARRSQKHVRIDVTRSLALPSPSSALNPNAPPFPDPSLPT